jgi:hypothetical protein
LVVRIIGKIVVFGVFHDSPSTTKVIQREWNDGAKFLTGKNVE